MENLPTPNDREEKILYAIATGDTDDMPTPKTRSEKLLMSIFENGSMTPGGGGTSDVAWKPTVTADGTISWIRSTSTTPPTTQNIKGPQGDPGNDGQPGEDGAPGLDGADGKSAYQIWLDAGNKGTEDDFLLALIGAPGPEGKSVYQIWLDLGNTGSEQDFLDSLVGEDGEKGEDGKSAYEIWLEAGNTGTEQEFIDSLIGEDGFSPTITPNSDNTDDVYKLDITTKDGTFTTPNLRGGDEVTKYTYEGTGNLSGETYYSYEDLSTKIGETVEVTVSNRYGESQDTLTIVSKISDTELEVNNGSWTDTIMLTNVETTTTELIDDNITATTSTWSSEKISRDYSTKEYVAEQISNTVHLVKEIVDAPPTVDEAKENVLYMVKDDTVASGDVYKEYQLINGAVVQTGDTSIDLSGYAKREDVENKAEINDTVTNTETTWSSSKISIEISNQIKAARQIYYELNQLEINGVVPGTIDEVFQSMPDGTVAMIPTDQFPYSYRENFPGTKTRLIMCRMRNSYAMAFLVSIESGDFYTSKWVYDSALRYAVFVEWVKPEAEGKVYTTLDELGLTADVTVDDVIGALKDGETAILATSEFTNQLTMFPNFCTNDQYAILQVEKKNDNRAFIEWRQKDGNAYAIGGLNSNNQFTNWDNIVRFKKDGFADDSIVTIGDVVSSDGTIQTLESLGFSNDILTWKNGVYKVSHVAGLVNLPKDINPDDSPAFKLEHHNLKKWQGNHNPSSATWGIRTSVFYADNGNIYTIHYQSGNTAGEYIINEDWKTIHTEKEDDNYIPNMYDRNANGDIPVVGFDRLANNMFLIQNQALIKEGETYDEDYVGGWVYTTANDTLVQKQEMFNKIKCVVAIPGVLRIGIMNEHLWDANPRYSTCLVKWLVSDFVAYTGLKEYDIEDTILEEGQYLFIECRAGESSWYYNSSTEAVKIGDVTYPASSCTSGLNIADKLDSTTNNVVFKSQSVTSTSARTYFGNGQYNTGSKYRTNFLDRHCTSTARTPVTPQQQSLYQGGLNVGLYRRTKYSDTRFCKCIENGMNISWLGDDSVTKIYAAIGQEKIVGKSVYAFKLDVNTPGNLTIYHLKGKSLDTLEIIDKYTHYVRAKGLQTIHLPFDIKLESEDEYIGFGGLHLKSTSDNIVRHGCKWQYMAGEQTTGSCGWMNTIGKPGFYSIGVSMTSYPETFTSFETNGSYLNIELICRGEKRSPLEDKYISFTGDSITTFANFVTTQTGYPAGNTAGDNAYYYPASGKVINNVDATWWGILARDNRMQILRNDAWSGSRVSSATGSTDTKCLCGTERRYYLRNTYEPTTETTYPFGIPEIVVNMIGTNDLSGNVELGEEMFKGVMGTEDEYKTILSAYSLMCRRFAGEYNKNGAKIVHFIILRGSDWGYANSNGVTIADLSLAFERIAKAWGQYFIPLSYFTGFNPAQYKKNTCPTASVLRNFRGTEFSNADGLHPNVVGMEILADGVDRFLKEIM